MPNYQIMKLCVRLASPKIAPVVFLTPDTLPDAVFLPLRKRIHFPLLESRRTCN